MKSLLFLLLLLPLSLFSQEVDSKYLAGAVPEVDGKVVFSQTLNIPNMSQDKIFDSMLEWANKYFQPNDQTNCKVLNANKEKGEIACFGAEYLILNPESILLNKALINYHLILQKDNVKFKFPILLIIIRYLPPTNRKNIPLKPGYPMNMRSIKIRTIYSAFRADSVSALSIW